MGFRRAVAHQASTDQTSIMAAVQQPIALACIQESAPVPEDKALVVLAGGRRPQRFMADRMGAKVRSHHVDHTPMYAEPNLVIEVMLQAARENPIWQGQPMKGGQFFPEENPEDTAVLVKQFLSA